LTKTKGPNEHNGTNFEILKGAWRQKDHQRVQQTRGFGYHAMYTHVAQMAASKTRSKAMARESKAGDREGGGNRQ